MAEADGSCFVVVPSPVISPVNGTIKVDSISGRTGQAAEESQFPMIVYLATEIDGRSIQEIVFLLAEESFSSERKREVTLPFASFQLERRGDINGKIGDVGRVTGTL